MSIIIPNGGHVINDATATPSDVVSGKVFYNNDGRIEGELLLDEYVQKKSIVLPEITSFDRFLSFTTGSMFNIGDNGDLSNGVWNGTTDIYYLASFKIGYSALMGLKVNDKLIPIYIGGNVSVPCRYEIMRWSGGAGTTYLDVTFKGGTVYYFYRKDEPYSLECIYI